ncbi:hypothetical protein SAMN04488579_10768 [Eubacterium barkeri]|uniref:Uncharacterized protein n=1 Tax=Eubacterium barkeri TaxID=1528 RepID=A0A1H3EHT9_EUBBA|nr:hypothetical protein SAMN04488579_10768 [Eubacterium barkeri]
MSVSECLRYPMVRNSAPFHPKRDEEMGWNCDHCEAVAFAKTRSVKAKAQQALYERKRMPAIPDGSQFQPISS